VDLGENTNPFYMEVPVFKSSIALADTTVVAVVKERLLLVVVVVVPQVQAHPGLRGQSVVLVDDEDDTAFVLQLPMAAWGAVTRVRRAT
jgi:hypothetical protein